MTIAAKHFDPIMGVDVHIILIPSPAGPIPTPLPNPYVGMVMDPFDYVPFVGATVKVNGVPRAQAGTAGIALVPHLPLGGPFGPPPPTNESEVFMGSATVAFDGDAQSYLGLPVLSCQSIGMPPPPRPKGSPPKCMCLPTCVVLAIPMGMLVMIGGPPTISLMALGFKAAMAGLSKLAKLGPIARRIKGASDAIHAAAEKAMKKLGLGDGARNAVHKGICSVTGHPVDIATGKVFTDRVDFEMAGVIPFRFERTWYSTSTYRGLLGHGWHHTYDQALILDDEVILYHTAEGRHVGLPHLKLGETYFDRRERLTFTRDSVGSYTLRTSDGLLHRFCPVGGRSRNELPLVEIATAVGNRLELRYDAWGRLVQVIDFAGRAVDFAYDEQGRLAALAAPHPDDPQQRVYVARYAYDGWGNLASVWDALGQTQTFAYEQHLLAKETDRNGLSFYFRYDGHNETARCVRTWGDGGIYDRKLTYDLDANVTVVENSLGYKTTYHHDGAMVTKVVDALGAVSETEYNDYNQVVVETDPLGRQTKYSYDERGNLAESVGPGGATLKLTHGPHDLPVRTVDELGGEWTWKRDASGRALEMQDPLGRLTKYHYEGPWLVGITDPTSAYTSVGYDPTGILGSIVMPDGGATRFAHDVRGRLVAVIDPKGNVQRRQLDALDRIVGITEPDGNQRGLDYDPEGNLVRARDQHYDVQFSYQGRGQLASRTSADTTVRFEYDTEEQFTGIIDQLGHAYRFKLGPTGKVDEEQGFDGLLRRYTRDAAGRIVRVDRPNSGRFTEFGHDAVDHVVLAKHSDGTREQYVFRIDGQLIAAIADDVVVKFERDGLGRIVKDTQGDHFVSSEYDLRGLRVRMLSSLGVKQITERNVMGDVMRVADEQGSYEATFSRDLVGLELERELPGGVHSRWQRDHVGRPIQHSVEAKTRQLRAVAYTWEANNRLKMVIDALRGVTTFGHDALGNLAWARYADGTVDHRKSDAIGNLFKSPQGIDRQYGAGGQVFATQTAQGSTQYKYDADGNLTEKLEPNGCCWGYEWNGAGRLVKVVRPDGSVVIFRYDAFGRRVSKTYRGQTTRWVWDGNNPVHEWVEGQLEPVAEAPAPPLWSLDAAATARETELQRHLGQEPRRRGTKDEPITWLFDPESFSPMAKVCSGEPCPILTDHLGTPVLMVDGGANTVWSANLSVYGELRELTGERHECPFRWPGQYEDAETGLYYNRYRFYDPTTGTYTSQDPIGLHSGVYNLYQHVRDPAALFDPLGLDWNYFLTDSSGKPYYHGRASENQTMADVARRHGNTTGTDGARMGPGDTLNRTTAPDTPKDAVRGIEERGVQEGDLLGRGSDKARGNKIHGISEAKQGTPEGMRRLAAGDALLDGRKPSEMPVLEKFPKTTCP